MITLDPRRPLPLPKKDVFSVEQETYIKLLVKNLDRAYMDIVDKLNRLLSRESFSVYRNASQTIPTTDWTKIEFDSRRFDDHKLFDISSGYNITPPKELWVFLGGGGIIDLDAGYFTQIALYIDGSNVARGSKAYSGASTEEIMSIGAWLVELNGSEVVDLRIYQSAPGNEELDVAANRAFFMGFRVI